MKTRQIVQRLIGALIMSSMLIGCATARDIPPTVAVDASPTLQPLAIVTPTPPAHAVSQSAASVGDAPTDIFKQTQPEELAKQATLIVIGQAEEQRTAMLPPGSPLAPPEPPGEPASHPLPYTETLIKIERILKGEVGGATLQVRTLGGEVNGVGLSVTHQAQLRTGQRVVLFLKQIEPEYYVVLSEDGIYEVFNDEAVGARHRFALPELLQLIERAGSVP